MFHSYAEFFILKAAFEEYQFIWDFCQKSGLVCLPFIGLFLHAIARAWREGGSVDLLLSEIEIHFFGRILCIVFMLQPQASLHALELQFSRLLCDTPFDLDQREQAETVFLDWPQNLKLPLAFGLSFQFSGWFIQQVKIWKKNRSQLRSILLNLDLATIQDLSLLMETRSFVSECFLPSLRRYTQGLSTALSPEVLENKTWMGDPYFMSHPGYYDYFRSISKSREEERVLEGGAIEVNRTYLSCLEWWGEPQGLKERLMQELRERVPGIASYLDQQDFYFLVQKMVQTTLKLGYSSHLNAERNEHRSSLFSWASRVMGQYEVMRDSINFYPFMSMLIEALPLIQGFILMAGIIFFPFYMLLQGYALRSCLYYMSIWCSVELWSYLWILAGDLDNLLIESLYPGLNLDFTGRILIDMIALLMYLLLPILLTSLVYIAVYKKTETD